MKTKLIATLILAGSSLFAAPRFSFGVNVGVPVVPVAPAPVVAYAPPSPGPGYVWVNGYYEFVGGRRMWREGYWRGPAFHSEFRGGEFREHFRR